VLGSKNKNSGHYETLISNKPEFVGNLHFSGGLHIDGRIKGNIIAEDKSGAVVRISETGVVEGEIRVPNVIINGRVAGNVYSSQHIELAKKADVQGDVHYTIMEMVMGAQVNGALVHQADPKAKGKARKQEPMAPEAVVAEKVD